MSLSSMSDKEKAMARFIGKAYTAKELCHLLDNLPYEASVNLEEVGFSPEIHSHVEVWYDRETNTILIR